MLQELKALIKEKEAALKNARTEDEKRILSHELDMLNVRLNVLYMA